MNRWVLVAEDERPLGEMLCDNLTLEYFFRIAGSPGECSFTGAIQP